MKAHQQFSHDKSDHISILHVYKAYKETYNKYKWCRDNYISFEGMKLISEISFFNKIYYLILYYKNEYLKCLYDINFITYEEYYDILNKRREFESINQYSKDSNMIKAAITAGLYPNILEIRKPKVKFEDVFYLYNIDICWYV